jgi:hypothetical protein
MEERTRDAEMRKQRVFLKAIFAVAEKQFGTQELRNWSWRK